MTTNRPFSSVLDKTAQRFSLALANIERFLSYIGNQLGKAIRRVAHSAWIQLGLGIKNLIYLLGFAWIFFGLVFFESDFHELTFQRWLLLKIFGWIGVVTLALVTLGAVAAMFFPAPAEKSSLKTTTLVLRFTVVNAIAVGILVGGTYWHYQFRSPVLRWSQSALLSAEDELVAIQSHGQSKTSPMHASSGPQTSVNSPQGRTASSLIAVPVLCKGDAGTRWASAINDGTADDFRLNMWVEKIVLTPTATVLHVAVKTWTESTQADLMSAAGAYFVDDEGNEYDLVLDQGIYPSVEHRESGNVSVRLCKGDDICRFTLVFQRLTHRSKFIYFHHPQFQRLEVDLEWNSGSQVAIPRAMAHQSLSQFPRP